jgi:hypothetical protein
LSNISSRYFILVQLGPSLPKYLIENIKWLKQNFAEHQIVVVIDDIRNLDEISELGAFVFSYKRTEETADLLKQLTHDLSFRRGFWHLTIERLFAICQAVSALGSEHALYIESDVLLLPSFPLDQIWSAKGLSWTRYNHLRDVPSLIHLENGEYASHLSQGLKHLFQIKPDLTDMSALHSYAELNQDIVCLFPTVHHGIENTTLLTNSEYPRISSKSHLSGIGSVGIFDGATFGMHLLGQDPRNAYGFTQFLNPELSSRAESYLDLSAITYLLVGKKLFVKTKRGECIEIYNLHVHSKEESYFSSNLFKILKKRVYKANNQIPYKEFHPKIFIKLLLENLLNRTFIPYIYGLIKYIASQFRLETKVRFKETK